MSIKRGAVIVAATTALLSLALPAHAFGPPVSSDMCQAGGGTVSASAQFGGPGQCSGGSYGGAIIIVIPR